MADSPRSCRDRGRRRIGGGVDETRWRLSRETNSISLDGAHDGRSQRCDGVGNARLTSWLIFE